MILRLCDRCAAKIKGALPYGVVVIGQFGEESRQHYDLCLACLGELRTWLMVKP